MKLLLKSRVLVFTAVCFLTITTLSGKKSHAAASNSQAGSNFSPLSEDSRQQLLAWNLKTLVQAYEQAGHTNLEWDNSAKLALTEFARVRARVVETNESGLKIISSNAAAAVRAGCDDPMVNYLGLRYSNNQGDSEEKLATEFLKIVKDINRSSYPSVRKFYAAARALRHASQMTNNAAAEMQLRGEIMPILIKNVEITLHDKSMPAREAYEVADETLSLFENNPNYKFAYAWLSGLFENWPDEYTTWLLKGKANIHFAWDARGNGYANTVTEEGWKLFKEHIGIAQESLERAWLLNPNDPEIDHEMINVTLGLEGKRDTMELWFDRAMALNTNDYVACRAKLNYLEPKWYGSDADQIEFGKWCVQSRKWGGLVPLTLLDAHIAISKRLDKSQQAGYWKQPDVWSDAQASLNRFFELNPNATVEYQTYALYAYKAEQWDKLNELIPKLDNIKSIDYEYFGSRVEFDKMIQLAREHAGGIKTAQKND